MNLLRGVFPVEGEGGGDCTHYLSFSGDRLSQADAKVASGAKGKNLQILNLQILAALLIFTNNY